MRVLRSFNPAWMVVNPHKAQFVTPVEHGMIGADKGIATRDEKARAAL